MSTHVITWREESRPEEWHVERFDEASAAEARYVELASADDVLEALLCEVLASSREGVL